MSEAQRDFIIREYQAGDHAQVCKLMEDFQGYLASVDSMKILLVDEDYGKKYTDGTLEDLPKINGKFLVAVEANSPEKIVGLAVGAAPEPSKAFYDLLGHIPKKEGRILELFVVEECRGRGIARELLAELDKFFLENKCTHVRLSVMADNTNAHQAYLKMGYRDRTIEVLKKII